MIKRLTLFPLMALALFVGCRRSPGDRVRDASNVGSLGLGATGTLVVFSDELKTGGGAFEYPGGENQTLSFSDQSNPLSFRSIRYGWNGQPPWGDQPAGCLEFHSFAGFTLMHTIDLSTYNTTPGRDLRPAGYTKLTFAARGTLSTNTVLKVEAATPPTGASTNACLPPPAGSGPSACIALRSESTDPGIANPCGSGGLWATLSPGWQTYTASIPNAALASVKDFFKATFVFTDANPNLPEAGQGGAVYFDQIQYQL